jgi:hypothetical protein
LVREGGEGYRVREVTKQPRKKAKLKRGLSLSSDFSERFKKKALNQISF